jgi:drug/metabolite transporter (DMT)-like permease
MGGMGERGLGVIMILGSAAVFALAGVLTKSIAADPMTIACWRGLVGGLLISAYVLVRRRRGETRERLALGWKGWVLVAVGAAASVAFIAAFKFTYVANVTIIYATVPFAAALLAAILIGETLRARTFAAATVSLGGVAIMVGGGLGGGGFGDLVALVMTLLSAFYIVLVRKFRDAPVIWAGAVSAFVLFGLGWLVTDPLRVTGHDAVLLLVFGSTFAIAVVLWTEGARLIPSAEAALLGLAEVPVGISVAWLILGEVPPAATFAGGCIVLAAVLWHALRDRSQARALPAS